MNIIQKWEAQIVLNKLWSSVDGYKTYILSGFGIAVALLGHYTGGTTIVGIQVPAFSWSDVWSVVYKSAIYSAIRHGIGGES